jgi:hypothetical protein
MLCDKVYNDYLHRVSTRSNSSPIKPYHLPNFAQPPAVSWTLSALSGLTKYQGLDIDSRIHTTKFAIRHCPLPFLLAPTRMLEFSPAGPFISPICESSDRIART